MVTPDELRVPLEQAPPPPPHPQHQNIHEKHHYGEAQCGLWLVAGGVALHLFPC